MSPVGGFANVANWLVNLHDARAVFDFCGGMHFQLVLSKTLHAHLATVGAARDDAVKVFDATKTRMAHIPGYRKCADADNATVFHGREIRKVDGAAGGMGMVLQLSLAGEPADPEGWTPQEVAEYDGWGHDSRRGWRNTAKLEKEGCDGFGASFGPKAITLHHRFYLHTDAADRLWLAAEDGCEGVLIP